MTLEDLNAVITASMSFAQDGLLRYNSPETVRRYEQAYTIFGCLQEGIQHIMELEKQQSL